MLISTVTLNPAIDKTYYVNGFSINNVNRAHKTKQNAGGKGINFTAVLSACRVPLKALGFLGEGGDMIESFLRDKGTETDFVRTKGGIRTNIKICDTDNKTYTDLNESGARVSESEILAVLKKIEAASLYSDMVYMGGSLPLGAPDDTYAKIIRACKSSGAVSAVDASGAALRAAVDEKPDIIKPNALEAAELLGIEINSIDDAALAVKALLQKGIKNVLLSLGGDGAVCADETGIYRVYPLPVTVKSTVGAGDSFLSGFVYGKTKQLPFKECISYAASFSAAKIEKDGTDIPVFDELIANVKSVKIKQLS